MVRAKTYEEIKPLIDLCLAGKLFDVQKWIACGKPINMPPPSSERHRLRSPLNFAICTGFHSLVEVLLDAGAAIEGTPEWQHCSDLACALEEKQFDIAKLLVVRGANVNCVNMVDVFKTWNYDIVEFFIEHGADVETGNPLAEVLCRRIRTALRAYKQYRDRFPSFREQANIALRYHCSEGNLKWVSLMLWLGADPHVRGVSRPTDEVEDVHGDTAMEIAALWEHEAILKLKAMHMNPADVRRPNPLSIVCCGTNLKILGLLLEKGYPVNDQENGGSSSVRRVLETMDWGGRWQGGADDPGPMRARIAMLEMLLQHGARWIPMDAVNVSDIRRRLLHSAPEATMHVVRLMAKYQSCTRDTVELLLKTPAIQGRVCGHSVAIRQFVDALPQSLDSHQSRGLGSRVDVVNGKVP